jgi:hypothetical protein
MSYTLLGTHVAAAAIAAALAWGFQGARHDAEIGDIRVAQADAQLLAVTRAQAKANANTARLTKALNNARHRQDPLARAAAVAERRAASLQELLNEANVRVATAAREAVDQYAAAANRVFGACVERYRELGKAASGHADDVRTFDEAWPDQ